MKKNKTLFLFLISLILTPYLLIGQDDKLIDLSINPQLTNYIATHPNKSNYNSSKEAPLSLPFFDDFSQYDIFPNSTLWEDNQVFINKSLAINPVSYGVATFDGLNNKGYPYNFINPTSYGIADSLTSNAIDLSTARKDSVFLSFYYQPQGLGNAPEKIDSLVLEFFEENNNRWNHVWSVTGEPTKPFKLVILKVNQLYHTTGFKFRFKNYATLSGNVDHWHLDYIYLNDKRTSKDTSFVDVALVSYHHNFLNKYSTMPWSHYNVDSTANMAKTLPTSYRNNTLTTTYPLFFKYQVSNKNMLITSYPKGTASRNIPPQSTLEEPHAVLNPPINNFYFKPDINEKTKVFKISLFFNLNTPDSVPKNDTLINYQVFGNEYGYDDGSAEAGYGILGRNSKLAQEFYIKKKDTLTAIKINFNPISNNQENKIFKLIVWESLNPEKIIYQETVNYAPKYLLQNNFYKYALSKPIVLEADTYYFGYSKVTEDYLNVGFDKNLDNSKYLFYSTGTRFFNANFKGSLMLRPFFSSNPDPFVSLKKIKESTYDMQVFPNPTNNNVHINYNKKTVKQPLKVVVLNQLGQAIKEKIISQNTIISLSEFSAGLYSFIFYQALTNKPVDYKKVILIK